MSNHSSRLNNYFSERINQKELPTFLAKLVKKWDDELETEILQQDNFDEFMRAMDACYTRIRQIDLSNNDAREQFIGELKKLHSAMLSCVPIRRIIGTALSSRRKKGGEWSEQRVSVLTAVHAIKGMDLFPPSTIGSALSPVIDQDARVDRSGRGASLASEKLTVYKAKSSWQTLTDELNKDPAALAEFLSTLSEERLVEMPVDVLQQIHTVVSKAIIKTAIVDGSDLGLWSGLSVSELSWASSQLTQVFNEKSQKKMLGLTNQQSISISTVNKFLRDNVGVELAEDEKKQLALIIKEFRASGAKLWFGKKPDRQECTLSSVFLSNAGKSCMKVLSVGASQKVLWQRYAIPESLRLTQK